jgi:hypothetical protein
MADKIKNSETRTVIQLKIADVIIFSVALVVAATLITFGLVKFAESRSISSRNTSDTDMENAMSPPWGQLIVRDIELAQPEEYVAYETATNRVETWIFEKMTPDEVRARMQSSGVAANEISRALSPPMMTVSGGNTVVMPDDELILSLSPQARAKLYNFLAQFNSDEFMRFPFVFRPDLFDDRFGGGKLDDATVKLLKQLIYRRGNSDCFSDLAIVLRKIPDDAERLRFVTALSQQSAVMVRLHIWPDTDVDKLIGYWGRGLQVKDVKPLLESLKRLPDGASMSILYFLPQFARQRLYTFPLPSHPGDPTIDCHWSTMNFFNDPPDNRFSDPKYIASFLETNYYQIAKPTAYGDVILVMDSKNEAIHSAVYLADNIVFTKNGNNFAQPWMLMRLNDLLAEYTTDTAPRLVVYRNKNW